MFRKRNVQASSATLVRKAEDEEPDAGSEADIRNNDEETTKRSRRTGVGGVLVVDEGASIKETSEKTIGTEVQQIFSGEDVEKELESRKANPAVVTVEQEKQTQKKITRFGPSSAPAYVRATTIIDYKPDLCKDYNETGYCGYGDTCIYLHDRTTYVSGNVLDKRWDEAIKKAKSAAVESKQALSQSVPDTCGICQKQLSSPAVKTRCGHAFCRACAFNRFDITSTCATCGLQTMGIFNDVKL